MARYLGGALVWLCVLVVGTFVPPEGHWGRARVLITGILWTGSVIKPGCRVYQLLTAVYWAHCMYQEGVYFRATTNARATQAIAVPVSGVRAQAKFLCTSTIYTTRILACALIASPL